MSSAENSLRTRNVGIRRVKVSDLEDAPWNFRTHPQAQREALAGAVGEIGFYGYPDAYETPEGTLRLVDGHLRKELLVGQYGPDAEIEVNVCDFDEAEAKKATLTKDPLAAMAEANAEKLDELLRDCQTGSEPLAKMLEGLAKEAGCEWAKPPGITEDEVPEPPAVPVTKPGDLWLLGEHRLLCGDSTKAEDVGRVMARHKAHACVTDPPYGVGVEYATFKDTPENVDALIPKVMPFILACQCAALTPGVPAMWSYPKPKWVGAWVHPAPCGGCPWGFVGNNPILYYGDDPYLKSGLGRRPDSIVMASDRQGVEGHPTPKPLKVWAWLVERLTPEKGSILFEPFSGSGTTFIVAEQLGRKVYGLELSPAYCDVILTRWSKLTGKRPKRESDGLEFEVPNG